MDKKEFEQFVTELGFKPDGEYEGVFNYSPFSIWLTGDGIAISYGMEYTSHFKDNIKERLQGLVTAFKKPM